MSWFRSSVPAFAPLGEAQLRDGVKDRKFLIVGGTKGIGAGLARGLLAQGAIVTVTGRSKNDETPSEATFIAMDASTMKACRTLVRQDLKGQTFDTVVFTVGIISRSKLTRTSEGIEEDLAVSYLSRFVIANEILKASMLTGRKRMYVMGYPGDKLTIANLDDLNYEREVYKQMAAHLNTVVCNEALVFSLAKRHTTEQVRLFGLNPGLIQTKIRDNFHGGEGTFLGRLVEWIIGWVSVDVDTYVKTVLLPLMAAPELDSKSAVSFSQKGVELPRNPFLQSDQVLEKIWDQSEDLVKRHSPE